MRRSEQLISSRIGGKSPRSILDDLGPPDIHRVRAHLLRDVKLLCGEATVAVDTALSVINVELSESARQYHAIELDAILDIYARTYSEIEFTMRPKS